MTSSSDSTHMWASAPYVNVPLEDMPSEILTGDYQGALRQDLALAYQQSVPGWRWFRERLRDAVAETDRRLEASRPIYVDAAVQTLTLAASNSAVHSLPYASPTHRQTRTQDSGFQAMRVEECQGAIDRAMEQAETVAMGLNEVFTSQGRIIYVYPEEDKNKILHSQQLRPVYRIDRDGMVDQVTPKTFMSPIPNLWHKHVDLEAFRASELQQNQPEHEAAPACPTIPQTSTNMDTDLAEHAVDVNNTGAINDVSNSATNTDESSLPMFVTPDDDLMI